MTTAILEPGAEYIDGSAAADGGMHAPGVGGRGLSQHRRGSYHPKGKKGRKGHAQGHGGRVTKRGGKGRGKEGGRKGCVEECGEGERANKGLPSPPGPMPRGLLNASGRNNCFLYRQYIRWCTWNECLLEECQNAASINTWLSLFCSRIVLSFEFSRQQCSSSAAVFAYSYCIIAY